MKDINWSSMSMNPRNAYAESFIDTIQDFFVSAHVRTNLFQHM